MTLIKKVMIGTLIAIGLIAIGTLLFLNTERFGKHPTGNRLQRVKASPNYRDGKFQNLNHTPMLAEGANYGKVLYEFLFSSNRKNQAQHFLPLKQI